MIEDYLFLVLVLLVHPSMHHKFINASILSQPPAPTKFHLPSLLSAETRQPSPPPWQEDDYSEAVVVV